MNQSGKRTRPKYPSGITGVYVSAMLSVLSVALAVLLFNDKPWLLLYYSIFSVLTTALVFELKNRVLYVRRSREYEDDPVKTNDQGKGGTRWRLLFTALVLLLLMITVPLALAYVLDPAIWVILIASFTTGVSVAEVTLYLYLRRPSQL